MKHEFHCLIDLWDYATGTLTMKHHEGYRPRPTPRLRPIGAQRNQTFGNRHGATLCEPKGPKKRWTCDFLGWVGTHRIHGTGLFTYICLIFMLNVGIHIPYMDPMEYGTIL